MCSENSRMFVRKINYIIEITCFVHNLMVLTITQSLHKVSNLCLYAEMFWHNICLISENNMSTNNSENGCNMSIFRLNATP